VPLLPVWRRALARPNLLLELLLIRVGYSAYQQVRIVAAGGRPRAEEHGAQVHAVERFLRIDIEHWANHAVVSVGWLRDFFDFYYTSFHFVVPLTVLAVLYVRRPVDYRWARASLGFATVLALVGFWLYPLAPPRMFPGFVDTLLKDPAFWSFSSGGMQNVSNQYAAMPSVHIAWATWCALALGPRLKNRTAATLAWCYPLITLMVIVITANHYILDAVAGVVILAIGWVAANRVTRAGRASSATGGRESPAHRVT